MKTKVQRITGRFNMALCNQRQIVIIVLGLRFRTNNFSSRFFEIFLLIHLNYQKIDTVQKKQEKKVIPETLPKLKYLASVLHVRVQSLQLFTWESYDIRPKNSLRDCFNSSKSLITNLNLFPLWELVYDFILSLHHS